MFELALPWVLMLLPLPVLIWYLLPRAPLQLPAALKIPFFNAMQGIVEHEKQNIVKHTRQLLILIIWALLVWALAGPRWVGEPQPLARKGYNIMLALDISGSMKQPDMVLHGRRVSRLVVVKQAAIQFVKDRIGDKIGLILFGNQAYLQTPLTYDRQNVLNRIEDATVGLAGVTNTSIGDALGLAVKRLQNVPAQGRVIILLTDGANNYGVLAPLKAAELAQADDIKVYTIGLGAEVDPQSIDSLFLNMNTTADLDEGTLKEIANMTGGRYFRATDMQSLQTVYQTINQLEMVPQEEQTVRPQHDYYPWPLALALILFVFWLLSQSGLLAGLSIIRRQEALTND